MTSRRNLHRALRILIAASLVGILGVLGPAIALGSGSSSGAPSNGISIRASSSAVRLPTPFVLSGMLLHVPVNGAYVKVYVRRPGSFRWSYSSTRGTYGSDGTDSRWWYRYTPRVLGTYRFYVSFEGTATYPAVSSPTTTEPPTSVVVR